MEKTDSDYAQEEDAQKEMPKYQCHKTVHALKIKEVLPGNKSDDPNTESDDGSHLAFENHEYLPIWVSAAWVQKHNPQAGGYYVVYDDGYKSYSPAKAFEDGYTLIKYA